MTRGEYLALVTNFHSNRPRFMNMLALLVQPLVDAQAMLDKMRADFDIDTAIGVQLDQVGQWLGRDRYLHMPISGVYFAFDTPGVGFDEGHWQGLFDPTDEIRALDDETYRSILKLQALANRWDGTLPSIAADFDRVFPGAIIDDRGDQPGQVMTMDVIIPSVWLPALLEAALVQMFPLKPSGVRVNILKSTVIGEPVFGFDVDNQTIGGFDTGAWATVIYSN